MLEGFITSVPATHEKTQNKNTIGKVRKQERIFNRVGKVEKPRPSLSLCGWGRGERCLGPGSLGAVWLA